MLIKNLSSRLNREVLYLEWGACSNNYCKLNILDAVEDIIWNFPKDINIIRHKDHNYDPFEAYTLLKKHNLMSQMQLTYELSIHHTVFSEKGMQDLETTVTKMIGEKKIGLFVCEPYSFLIGSNSDNLFLVDTHPVSETFGGCKTGILLFSSKTYEGSAALCEWLWKRMYGSNVQEGSKQSFSSVIFDFESR